MGQHNWVLFLLSSLVCPWSLLGHPCVFHLYPVSCLLLSSSQNVTKGARHKIALSIQKLRERQSVLKSLEKVRTWYPHLQGPVVQAGGRLWVSLVGSWQPGPPHSCSPTSGGLRHGQLDSRDLEQVVIKELLVLPERFPPALSSFSVLLCDSRMSPSFNIRPDR